MAELKPGDFVEYTQNNLSFTPMVGAVGLVHATNSKHVWVTWISVPQDCNQWSFVRAGVKEHWWKENFRKLGEVERGS